MATIDDAGTSRKYVLASRVSQLAQVQTNVTVAAFEALPPPSNSPRPTFTTSFLATVGDRNQSQALFLMGGKALWTKELEVALKEGEVDMLIHCLKDIPTVLPDSCIIGAIMEREDPVGSLVIKKGKEDAWRTLDDLPAGSVVGMSSVRRVAQLKRNSPKLKFLDVLYNRNTWLAKLDADDGPYAALILAKSGMLRVGMGHCITTDLPPPTLFHAVSQGGDDTEVLKLCESITHKETQIRCLAERACLRVLEGGCSVPVWVNSTFENGALALTGCVTSLDGNEPVKHTLKEPVSSVVEAEAAGEWLMKVLIASGTGKILDDINIDQEKRTKNAEEAEKAKYEEVERI
ncbi:porphobilinogen deaminase, dipyromethane cofactor binding domain-containing protein [Armillaria luteobubalina]|uniref:hydroxymethylbilane synthase n=1 Tax=Armillaria luteobubalina TaxID=153913 RepID=A0AA39UVS9_9AGAR|nr:porphobilinogen deaminase, dipyromethane cofactor binding domain-containing protein [Armillaria luteobubalina]